MSCYWQENSRGMYSRMIDEFNVKKHWSSVFFFGWNLQFLWLCIDDDSQDLIVWNSLVKVWFWFSLVDGNLFSEITWQSTPSCLFYFYIFYLRMTLFSEVLDKQECVMEVCLYLKVTFWCVVLCNFWVLFCAMFVSLNIQGCDLWNISHNKNLVGNKKFDN